MTLLIVGLAVFFATHVVSIVNEPWRNATVARLGEGPWKMLYSVLAIVGFVLIIQGYGAARADPVVLYTSPAWMRHVTALLMLAAFPLLLAAYLPGKIKAKVKHPLLAATKLWALAHLLSNGTLADVVLFGSFLVWAVADRISMKHRVQRPIPMPRERRFNDLIAVVGGLAIYGVFVLWLHQKWFGVSPV